MTGVGIKAQSTLGGKTFFADY